MQAEFRGGCRREVERKLGGKNRGRGGGWGLGQVRRGVTDWVRGKGRRH